MYEPSCRVFLVIIDIEVDKYSDIILNLANNSIIMLTHIHLLYSLLSCLWHTFVGESRYYFTHKL